LLGRCDSHCSCSIWPSEAAATFHGGGLITDKPDSPHRVLGQTHAAYLITVARNDDQAPRDKDACVLPLHSKIFNLPPA
jgi:hypothetical protein